VYRFIDAYTSLTGLIALIIQAVRTSEKSVYFYETTRRHIQKDVPSNIEESVLKDVHFGTDDEWLAPQLVIPEVPVTNLGLETSSRDRIPCFFSRVMLGQYVKLGQDRFLPHPFQQTAH
jgi:hypothetical protein